jgi:hypothetical protein
MPARTFVLSETETTRSTCYNEKFREDVKT